MEACCSSVAEQMETTTLVGESRRCIWSNHRFLVVVGEGDGEEGVLGSLRGRQICGLIYMYMGISSDDEEGSLNL
jgi:hypothetical protein